MEKELEILNHIQDNENITQREIAERTGLSLGAVNLLLKKMLKTGLIKIERLNARSLKYILTPEGIKEKTAKTYHYIVNSYHTITRIRAVVQVLIQKQMDKGIRTVYLYGAENEIYQVLRMTLGEIHLMDVQCIKVDTIQEIVPTPYTLVLVWDEQDEKTVIEQNMYCINILSKI